MNDAMDDEFDTVAGWTADAALALGRDHFEPAGCRGSGGPQTLDALLDRLAPNADDRLLDVGAGVGGPAGYAARTRGVRPVLLEPEPAACRAARRLFGLPVAQTDATALPVADGSFPVVWSLGVLCTVPDKRAALREMRRVLRPDGVIGLLVFEAQGVLPESPDGNSFPSAASLAADIAAAGLTVAWRGEMTSLADEAPDWRRRTDAVDAELGRQHDRDDAWISAEEQSGVIGRLLADRHLVGRLLTLRRYPDASETAAAS